ncbi:MAG TPA: M48 family metalloprotease [Pirellulaceae bacterium]|nr:M48 family metalloprotease [Pirellulaceae bacterium]
MVAAAAVWRIVGGAGASGPSTADDSPIAESPDLEPRASTTAERRPAKSPSSEPTATTPSGDDATAPSPAAKSADSGPAGTPHRRESRQNRSFNELFEVGFEIMHEQSRGLNRELDKHFGLTLEEEAEYGALIHRDLTAKHRRWDSPHDARLETLARQFLGAAPKSSRRITITVLDEPEINAFAHVGGYVYFYRGLLELLRSDDELRFVLGHEIAHLELRHCAGAMTVPARTREIAGDTAATAARLFHRAIALGYSEAQEFEADAWCCDRLLEGGATSTQIVASFETLRAAEAQRSSSRSKVAGSTGRSVGDVLADHLRSHPPLEQRIARLRSRAAREPARN